MRFSRVDRVVVDPADIPAVAVFKVYVHGNGKAGRLIDDRHGAIDDEGSGGFGACQGPEIKTDDLYLIRRCIYRP